MFERIERFEEVVLLPPEYCFEVADGELDVQFVDAILKDASYPHLLR